MQTQTHTRTSSLSFSLVRIFLSLTLKRITMLHWKRNAKKLSRLSTAFICRAVTEPVSLTRLLNDQKIYLSSERARLFDCWGCQWRSRKALSIEAFARLGGNRRCSTSIAAASLSFSLSLSISLSLFLLLPFFLSLSLAHWDTRLHGYLLPRGSL